MEVLYLIVLVSLQISLFLYIIYHTGYAPYRKSTKKVFYKTHYGRIEIFLFILLILCFLFHELSGFYDQVLFPLYGIITFIAAVFYWLNKLKTQNKPYHFIRLMFTSTLLWIAALTTIKFLPYLPFIWFPLYGIFAFAPILFVFLTFTELYKRTTQYSTFDFKLILLSGVIPLLTVFASLIIFTDNAADFVDLFTPVKNIL